ncbi:MAG TPA: SDR family oxidoreductase [Burkholderiales bacterium]|nr:SDR family oxidoreductase [Burkholderiales bacterium]
MAARTALVTGANRGLGLETSRQLARAGYRVLLASRDLRNAEAAAKLLRGEKLDVRPVELDVASDASCARLEEIGAIDALVNNAGVMLESDENPLAAGLLSESALDIPPDLLRETFETNVLGAYRVIQALAPGMRERRYGRIVNVSSGLGQLNDMGGGYPAYRISKTALNALTRIFSAELGGTGVLVNSVCPGWVKTDMGGPQAKLEPEEGVKTIVWAATLPDDGPTGGFFRALKPIPW